MPSIADPSAEPHPPDSDLEQAARVFAEVRPRLFGIAYRMLSSAAEAEDLVQEVWLRWQTCDRSAVTNPAAYLATTTTRLAINAIQSARVRRETYVGPWLPEPVDTSADPYLGAERGDALELAVLVLLERLKPNERAAYVLREAFDYPYPQIAEILQLHEPAVRQLVSRARKRVTSDRRTPVSEPEQRQLLSAFISAARSGDLAALENLFAAGVSSYSDGGGVVRAARIPVHGADRVAKFVRAFAGHFWGGIEVEWRTLNGRQAALLRRDGVLAAVVSVDASADGIEQIMWLMNPDKLEALAGTG
ncbi:RNA polymerase, sigma-24 subunit, ECF subfamily [Kribbella flavida DSM 17836]|uniref:RNA polymerase, sigma-24 subunit, ECF subfamily n=1 Tax=Kribbella flavida (strain DSM 17836 / JCM 10339 / NBRC 14399) TaxID=479435 RepID=D2PYV1_KRIFD|nr:RNA polymerase sigma-70 factor [Kribbella flavida]ADB31745.1 RNA polymerase, sigma-24 subunit, ECF subfamily [Kribbella flavida DSM 17836]